MLVVAVVPVYNEADCIGDALAALRDQSRPVDKIIVTIDQYKDENVTREIENIALEAGAEVWHSVGNKYKKAGNLNGALAKLLPTLTDDDAILIQDADTFLDRDFIKITVGRLERGFGAAGGNFRGRAGGKLCGVFQRNEFARYARDTSRKKGKILCLTGTACLFKVQALNSVLEARKSGKIPAADGVYDTKVLTEDNELTLALKHIGWRIVAPARATMSTEVMETWRDLGKQRLRWKRGALENLFDYGLTRYTLEGWGRQVVAFLGASISVLYVGSLLWTIITGGNLSIAPFWMAFTAFYAIERAVTVKTRGWRVTILSMLVIPEWFYELFLQGVHVRALVDTALRKERNW